MSISRAKGLTRFFKTALWDSHNWMLHSVLLDAYWIAHFMYEFSVHSDRDDAMSMAQWWNGEGQGDTELK